MNKIKFIYLMVCCLLLVVSQVGCGTTGSGGDDDDDNNDNNDDSSFTLTSADMPEGEFIPTTYTAGPGVLMSGGIDLCTGEGSNISPVLSWIGAPATGVSSFAVTMWDVDYHAFDGDEFIHWIVYNIPTTETGLARDAGKNLPTGASHGINDSGDSGDPVAGYFGPCSGGADHRYEFTVWALSIENLEEDTTLAEIGIDEATPTNFREAIERNDLDSASLTRNSTGE